MFQSNITHLAQQIITGATVMGRRVVTAESCTGGLVAAALTSISGASEVFERGFITYSNASKHELLGVPSEILDAHGAVSAEVVEAMARGALVFSAADLAVAVTGIAGPGGGTADKPVGLVYFGLATREGVLFHARTVFEGDRDSVRLQSVREALTLLLSVVAPDRGSENAL